MSTALFILGWVLFAIQSAFFFANPSQDNGFYWCVTLTCAIIYTVAHRNSP